MGWSRHKLNDQWTLYTRGGLEGIYVTNGDIEVEIPQDLLEALAADQILSNQIRKLESLADVVKYVGLK